MCPQMSNKVQFAEVAISAVWTAIEGDTLVLKGLKIHVHVICIILNVALSSDESLLKKVY